MDKVKRFRDRASEIHNGKYDYHLVEYVNSHTKVCIICPKHGEFWQTPSHHLRGQGCPLCKKDNDINQNNDSHTNEQYKSKSENDVVSYIKTIYDGTIIQNDRELIKPYELDIYLPDKNLAIEYDGLIWHSDIFGKNSGYHLMKTELCEDKNVRLIHLFDNEWVEHKEIIKARLRQIILSNEKEDLGNKKHVIKEMKGEECLRFVRRNSTDCIGKTDVRICLKCGKKTVSMMSLTKSGHSSWFIDSYVENINYSYRGVFSSMIRYFKDKYKPSRISVTLDRRWWSMIGSNIYIENGFFLDKTLSPKHFYIVGGNRLSTKVKRGNKKSRTPKIYNCGYLRLVWKENKKHKK